MKAEDGSAARAIALLSGGLDSTVCLAETALSGKEGSALFFDYGQHAARREEEAARAVSAAYGFSFQKIELPWLAERSRSALLVGKGEPPVWSENRLEESSARTVWVENRNGIFIAVAAFVAAESGCGIIVVGFNREEAAAFSDNSAEYLRRTNDALELGLRARVRVESPTLSMTKAEIARRGLELDIPWHRLWSCYRGGELMCGRCESCLRLARAVEGTAASGKVRFGKEET